MSSDLPAPEVEVAAAVLLREDAFLLACRPEGKAYAGYWEFPGGKVEAGESVLDALVRELWEEMGITITRATPWLTRRHVYPHARVRIHFWRVTEWIGEIGITAPLEHSAIAWQALYGPPSVAPMLPANAPILKALALPAVMAITHAEKQGVSAEQDRLRAGLQSGEKLCIQIRDRTLPPAARQQWAREAAALVAPADAPVFVSEEGSGDGIRLAREIGAAGVHLTSSALARCETRPDFFPWVGASCHTGAELERAERLGLDYALLGPVLPTPSHPDAPGLGWEFFSRLVEPLGIPVFALGGQTRKTLEIAQQHGAHGIATLRGALEKPVRSNPGVDDTASRIVRQRFDAFAQCYCADASLRAQLADELVQCYSAAGRHYHSLTHLAFMLDELDRAAQPPVDRDALCGALFYHDIVYVPTRDDNEAQSAERAADHLARLGLPPEQIDKVRRMILATRTHLATGDSDTDLLIDLDLAVLGQVRSVYLRTVTQIRMEYAAIDEARWNRGRCHMLDHFLAQPQIYKTPEFRERYETSARHNLVYERRVRQTALEASS